MKIKYLTANQAVSAVKKLHPSENLCAIGDNFTATVGSLVTINSCFKATLISPGKLWAVGQHSVAVSAHPKGEVFAVHPDARVEHHRDNNGDTETDQGDSDRQISLF